ncbi:ATF3 factor, partial [Polyodon spathula]|nr:ATF3 factor [Polyodon spathula]
MMLQHPGLGPSEISCSAVVPCLSPPASFGFEEFANFTPLVKEELRFAILNKCLANEMNSTMECITMNTERPTEHPRVKKEDLVMKQPYSAVFETLSIYHHSNVQHPCIRHQFLRLIPVPRFVFPHLALLFQSDQLHQGTLFNFQSHHFINVSRHITCLQPSSLVQELLFYSMLSVFNLLCPKLNNHSPSIKTGSWLSSSMLGIFSISFQSFHTGKKPLFYLQGCTHGDQLPLSRLPCLLHHLAAYLLDGPIQRGRSTHPSSVKSPIPLFKVSPSRNPHHPHPSDPFFIDSSHSYHHLPPPSPPSRPPTFPPSRPPTFPPTLPPSRHPSSPPSLPEQASLSTPTLPPPSPILITNVPGSVKSRPIGGLTSPPLQKSQTLGTSLSPFVSRSSGIVFLLRGGPPSQPLHVFSVAGSSAPGMCRHRRPQSVTTFYPSFHVQLHWSATRIPPEENERRKRRRERNKIAATKCRNKKKERTDSLQKESEKLESINADLKAQIEVLKSEKQQLVYMLNLHRPTCIVRAQNGRTPEDERNLFLQQIADGTLQG